MRTNTAQHTCISQNQSRILYRGQKTTTAQLARLYRSSYQHAQAQLARLCYQMTQTDVLPQVQRSVDRTSSRYCLLLLYTSKKKYLVHAWISECTHTHMMLLVKEKSIEEKCMISGLQQIHPQLSLGSRSHTWPCVLKMEGILSPTCISMFPALNIMSWTHTHTRTHNTYTHTHTIPSQGLVE